MGTLAKAIAKMVMNIADKRKKSEKRKDVFSNDFYEKGFKYFVFEDRTIHCFSTDVNMYELKNTPEYYMLKLASKANVVALSATANIDSVICNYNMNYLKVKLGDKFYCLSEEEKKEIRVKFSTVCLIVLVLILVIVGLIFWGNDRLFSNNLKF